MFSTELFLLCCSYCCCLVTKSCPTLCNPMDYTPPGSSVHGILQARIPEWVAMPSPGDLPNPEIKPRSPALAGGFFTTEHLESLYCQLINFLTLKGSCCSPRPGSDHKRKDRRSQTFAFKMHFQGPILRSEELSTSGFSTSALSGF